MTQKHWGRGSTRQSRKQRLVVLKRDPICYLQLPGCTQISTVSEHVLGRASGGGEELDNKRGACKSCNDKKRLGEAAAGQRRASISRPTERHPGQR